MSRQKLYFFVKIIGKPLFSKREIAIFAGQNDKQFLVCKTKCRLLKVGIRLSKNLSK